MVGLNSDRPDDRQGTLRESDRDRDRDTARWLDGAMGREKNREQMTKTETETQLALWGDNEWGD